MKKITDFYAKKSGKFVFFFKRRLIIFNNNNNYFQHPIALTYRAIHTTDTKCIFHCPPVES